MYLPSYFVLMVISLIFLFVIHLGVSIFNFSESIISNAKTSLSKPLFVSSKYLLTLLTKLLLGNT